MFRSARLRLFTSRLSPFKHLRRVKSSGIGNGGGGGKTPIDAAASGSGGKGGWGHAIWAAYLVQLDKRPVVTKMFTSGAINALGDVIAQSYFESESKFKWKRLLIFTLIGLFVVGPTLHVCYQWIYRLFSKPGLRSAVGSVLVDQFAFAPCFCGVILSLLTVTETHKLSSIKPKLEQDWMQTVIVNWKIWIPAQLVNFWVVPPHHRVLFSNIVALIWTTYLSYASHKRIQLQRRTDKVL